MILDSKKSWSNLPYALMPACVGIFLLAFPWLTSLDPKMTAPIMLPFGVVWMVIALCISGYQSEIILDEDSDEVQYRTSLVLHSWANKVARGNVNRVLLNKESSKYKFVMEVKEGEDLSISTFDYWRSREWSEHVAAFLQVPLVDNCRGDEEISPDDLEHSILEDQVVEPLPKEAPGKIGFQWHNERRATISIPPRGLLPSARPRLAAGFVALLGGVAGVVMIEGWGWLLLVLAMILAALAFFKPMAQATHKEELEVSPNGVLVTITTLGRSHRTSIAAHEIRAVSVVKGEDVRFEHADFDYHAVCLESREGHIQLGASLPKLRHVEWLNHALLHILTKKD